ncbi:MAG: DM13 domain-containing protein [Phyllobacteriaceae bacterium]|nr:DM13 domain-containing protein [Phyllobacteriaceae bacterium]
MRLRRLAIAVLCLLSADLGRAAATAADEASVPGPLRPLPVLPAEAAPVRRPPGPVARPVQPPRAAVRTWAGRLAPLAKGELARGSVRLDVAAHRVEISDFAVTDGPELEVALVAGDRPTTTAEVLSAKRVSLGRLKRIREKVTLRFPAELDPAVYRTLVVWSRRDRAPRAVAPLAPDRAG